MVRINIKIKTLLYRRTRTPAFILLYVFYHIAFNVPVIYTIDIGSDGDTDSGSDAYAQYDRAGEDI